MSGQFAERGLSVHSVDFPKFGVLVMPLALIAALVALILPSPTCERGSFYAVFS
jgi:hypothetical protein